MAKQTGGLLGRPSGKIAGIVFGAARSRQGKVVTAREKVRPSNPRTPAQVSQREDFANALAVVRGIGPDIYQADFNRSVSQLPGFQSLMALVLGNMSSNDFDAPPVVKLGDLHTPSTITIVPGGAGDSSVNFTWSVELGANGTLADVVVAGWYALDSNGDAFVELFTIGATRTDGDAGGFEIVTTPSTAGVAFFYFQGAGAADGLLSNCTFVEVSSSTGT